MNCRPLLLPITLAAGLLTPLAARAETPPSGPVRQLIIVHKGTANISNEAIRAHLTQKVGTAYDAAAAQKDEAALKETGFFNGTVTADAAPDPAGGVDLTYTVIENPVIKSIVFTANTPDGRPSVPAATLKSRMHTKEGQVLNTTTLMQDLNTLFSRQTGYMRSQGYLVDVGTDVNVDPNAGTLTIPLIESHIQAVQVKGNHRLSATDILRPVRSLPGEVLDENKLQRDLTRLYDTGAFDQVGPYQITPIDIGQVTVTIPVREKSGLTDADTQAFPARVQIAAAYQAHEAALPARFSQFATLFPPDFQATDTTGVALTRAQYLKPLVGPLGPAALIEVDHDITAVQEDGDEAVVSLTLRWFQWANLPGSPDGGCLAFQQSCDDTWKRLPGGWSLASRKATSPVTKTVAPPSFLNTLRARASSQGHSAPAM